MQIYKKIFIKTKKKRIHILFFIKIYVLRVGLEPTLHDKNLSLNQAGLPIPPSERPRYYFIIYFTKIYKLSHISKF